MRHYLTSLFLVAALSVSAAILSPEEALQRALSDHSGPSRIPGGHQIEMFKAIDQTDGTPAAYLFSDAQSGWLLVSASDATAPLLGYGHKFDPSVPMPPQMEWWLSQYAAQIRVADSIAGVNHAPKRIYREKSPSKSKRKAQRVPIEPLMSTLWDQGEPYNLYAPEVNGEKAPTGCVATAISQVMKHHNYPASATGTGYATAGSQQLSLDLDVAIQWGDMLDFYNPWEVNYTDRQAEAVATLMQLAGYACRMQYSAGMSGAYDLDANQALVENFSYPESAWTYYRDDYPLDQWEDMLYEELAGNRPVYYSGRSAYGGHAFVCDGYEGNGYFHFNWGWSGWFDGMFLIDALNPDGQGTGGFEGGYNFDQMAIMGIEPPGGNLPLPTPRLRAENTPVCDIIGYDILKMSGGWFNYSWRPITLQLGLELTNKATQEKIYVEGPEGTFDRYYGYTSLGFDLTGIEIPDGDYTASIVTRENPSALWLAVLCPYYVTPFAQLSRTDGQWNAPQDLPLEVTDAQLAGQLYIDKPCTCKVTIENPGDFTQSDTYSMFLCKEEDGNYYIVAESDSQYDFPVTLDPHASATLDMPFVLTANEDFEYNMDYCLLIADPYSLMIDYIVGTFAINQDIVVPESITLSHEHANMDIGETLQLTATVNPENANDKTVAWTSSNPEIATVSDTGLVTAIASGSASIKAATSNGIYSTCAVDVNTIGVSTITLNLDVVTLNLGDVITLTATTSPQDATDKTITWSSSNSQVAAVEDGVVSATGIGECDIIATAHNGVNAKCHVKVKQEASGISFNTTLISMNVGEQSQIEVTFSPENTTERELTWTSSNPEVATVTDGLVKAIGRGETTITATTSNGLTATCAVTVIQPVESVTISQSNATLNIGETLQLTANVNPGNANDQTIAWTSSDSRYVTVSETGLVTAVMTGEATVTASASNGASASCNVTVRAVEPESISLDLTEVTIYAGDSQTLTATITPADVTDAAITWSTSDPGVATVENGVVTGVAGGACTVKAATVNGLEAACEVTVREKATGIELSETELNLEVGDTHQLTVTFYPETTTERHVTWVTSDASVATVEDGLVTVVGVGTARIKANYAMGISATCVVNATADVDVLLADGATCDVYTVTGILVRRDATRRDLERLTPDVYILRRGATVVKLHLP